MTKIVFITRGCGFGHAAQDLLIIEALRRMRPDVEMVLASSGTGLDFYRGRSVPCVDLGIADEEDTDAAAAERVAGFLRDVAPADLVIAHEVMPALRICRKVLNVNCVLLTPWFYSELGRADLAPRDAELNQATAIVVPDFEAVHPGLTNITVPVHFTGPLVRRLSIDRATARRELRLPGRSFVGVVTLGGTPDRPRGRAIARFAAMAWTDTADAADRLIVLADPDPRATALEDATVRRVGITNTPETYFRAADVVITDARGSTVYELVRAGIRTVAVTTAMNRATERRLRLLESAGLITTIHVDADPHRLRALIDQAQRAQAQSAETDLAWAGAEDVAAVCLRYLGTAGRRQPEYPPDGNRIV